MQAVEHVRLSLRVPFGVVFSQYSSLAQIEFTAPILLSTWDSLQLSYDLLDSHLLVEFGRNEPLRIFKVCWLDHLDGP